MSAEAPTGASEMRASCVHEAAHTVVAHALGMRVAGISPADDGDGYGMTLMLSPCGCEAQAYTRAIVALASATAVVDFGYVIGHSCAHDFEQACAWLCEWRGETVCGEELLAMVMRAQATARDIVRARRKLVETLADFLESNGCRASAAEIASLLEGEARP